MTDAPETHMPDVWAACVEKSMERFDVETAALWRRILEADQRMLMGVFLAWDEAHFGEVILCPLWHEMPASVWHDCPAEVVIDSLAIAVGRTRGQGEDGLVPTCTEPGFELAGLGLVTSEHHPKLLLTSNTFYLVDRAGGFFTRRFMGGNQGAPEVTRGYINPECTQEQYDEYTANHPDYHHMHDCLGRLMFACVGERSEAAELFGKEYNALVESLFSERLN